MVETITSYDVNFFNSAYDNICLIADKVWEYNQEDPYRKLNRMLWVKISKLSRNRNRKKVKLVSNVIPNSRLAKYGNYNYNDERESLYVRDVDYPVINEPCGSYEESNEPWLDPNVDEYFTRLKLQSLQSEALLDNGTTDSRTIDEEYKKYCRSPYTINSPAELQLKLRISSDKVLDLWRRNGTEQFMNHDTVEYSRYGCNKEQRTQQTCYQNRRCIDSGKEVLCNVQTHTIVISKNRYRERDCKCSAKTTVPILSAEVPEFFPKGPRLETQYESVPLQYFPTIPERIYNRAPLPNVSAMFQNPGIPLLATPIMSPLIRSPQWLPRIAPPLQIQVPVCTLGPQTFTTIQSICPILHRPLQLHDKLMQPNHLNSSAIPMYQRPLDYTADIRRKTSTIDFKNLILLTKNGMKPRRNQSKHSDYYNLPLEPNKTNLESESEPFVDRGTCPKRPKPLVTSTPVSSSCHNSDSQFEPDTICERAIERDNELLMTLKR